MKSLIASISEDEFEQYLNEQDLNLKSHVIRYDFSRKGYNPLVHSCSHIHIGMNAQLRIPCSKILTPLRFITFDQNTTPKFVDTANSECKELDETYWADIEKYELFLS